MKRRNQNSLIFRSIVELKKLLHFEYPTRYIWAIKMRNLNFHGTKLMIIVVVVAESRHIGGIIFRSMLWMIGYIFHSLVNNMQKSCNSIVKITNLNFSLLSKLIYILDSIIDLWKSSTFSHYRKKMKAPMLCSRFSMRDLAVDSEKKKMKGISIRARELTP